MGRWWIQKGLMKNLGFVLLPALSILVGGCKKYSEAEWEVGRVYLHKFGKNSCKQRTALAEIVPPYYQFYGTYKGSPHTWKEKYINGEWVILDPSVADTNPRHYKRNRMIIHD